MQELEKLEDEVYVLREEVKALRKALKVTPVESSWNLTRKERQIFEMLKPNILVTVEQLHAGLYADRIAEDDCPELGTVKTHVSTLRAKLYAAMATWWLSTVPGDGFILHTATVEQTRRLNVMGGHRFHRGPGDLSFKSGGAA